jgi:hypothetical protein
MTDGHLRAMTLHLARIEGREVLAPKAIQCVWKRPHCGETSQRHRSTSIGYSAAIGVAPPTTWRTHTFGLRHPSHPIEAGLQFSDDRKERQTTTAIYPNQ